MNQSGKGLAIISLYLFVSIYLIPYFPGAGSERETLNWASTASIVERTTFDVSGVERKTDRKFDDVKRIGQRAYADGPPGLAIISAPFYAIARIFLGEAGPGNVLSGWNFLRIVISTLPLLILAGWLYASDVDPFSLAVLLFATPLFQYSLLYYSHVLVAILIYLAFRVIYDFDRIFPGRCFTAGAFIGLALICSYWSSIPAILFFLGLFFTEKHDRARRVLFYVAGVVPFLAGLALYYYLVHGSPTEALHGLMPSLPSLTDAYQLLISPAGGLFTWAPVLLFSLLVVFTSREEGSRRFRVKYITIFAALVAALFFGSGTGSSAGPSVLLFVVPLMLDSFFDGETDEYSSLWRGFFFTASFLMCTLPMLTNPFAPAEYSFPHNSYWQPLIFSDGAFANTALIAFGVKSSIWTFLPVFGALFLVLYIVWRSSRYPAKFAVGILAGILLVGNYMFFPGLE